MIYKCKNCGGALEYSPELDKMLCSYCETSYTIDELSALGSDQDDENKVIKESPFEFNKPTDDTYDPDNKDMKIIHDNRFEFNNPSGFASSNIGDYDTVLKKNEIEAKKKEQRKHASIKMHIMKCTSCGAELCVNSVEASTFCSYCGQPTVVSDRVEEYLQPDYIIPFKVNKDDAERIIRDGVNEGFFIPKYIKNFQVDRIRGIYVPFWLFDIYYHDKQYYRYKKKQGKASVTRYEYFEGETNFRRMTIDASKNLNDDSSSRLEPYDMRQLISFDPSYLAGFYSDRFDLGYEDITGCAVAKAKDLYNSRVRNELKHSGELVSCDPDYRVQNTEYALLPAWFLTFVQNGNTYTILVNGQTGKMIGALPLDKKKSIFLFVILAIILSLIGVLLCTFLSHFFFLQVGLDEKITFLYMVGCPLIAFLFAKNAVSRFKALKKSLSLTTSKTINRFAKERTDR